MLYKWYCIACKLLQMILFFTQNHFDNVSLQCAKIFLNLVAGFYSMMCVSVLRSHLLIEEGLNDFQLLFIACSLAELQFISMSQSSWSYLTQEGLSYLFSLKKFSKNSVSFCPLAVLITTSKTICNKLWNGYSVLLIVLLITSTNATSKIMTNNPSDVFSVPFRCMLRKNGSKAPWNAYNATTLWYISQ